MGNFHHAKELENNGNSRAQKPQECLAKLGMVA
jgi:hypothetical protein